MDDEQSLMQIAASLGDPYIEIESDSDTEIDDDSLAEALQRQG